MSVSDFARTTAALGDIVRERAVQVTKGYTPEHDDTHVHGELAHAAAYFAMPDCADNLCAVDHTIDCSIMWPFEGEPPDRADRRAALVTAGALILAEIERLDRAAARS
jgi:hypothetical protein